jgi:hypothetical protein
VVWIGVAVVTRVGVLLAVETVRRIVCDEVAGVEDIPSLQYQTTESPSLTE